MKAVDELVEKLRYALNDENLDSGELENLVEQLVANESLNIKILDFEYYNEERYQHTKIEKIKSVKAQNFVLAASWRDKEKEIAGYIEIKEEFEIEKSRFHYQEGYLLYFYLGTEKNDEYLKELIKTKLKK